MSEITVSPLTHNSQVTCTDLHIVQRQRQPGPCPKTDKAHRKVHGPTREPLTTGPTEPGPPCTHRLSVGPARQRVSVNRAGRQEVLVPPVVNIVQFSSVQNVE